MVGTGRRGAALRDVVQQVPNPRFAGDPLELRIRSQVMSNEKGVTVIPDTSLLPAGITSFIVDPSCCVGLLEGPYVVSESTLNPKIMRNPWL